MDYPWVLEGSSLKCSESASGLERLEKAREEQEEAGGARAEGRLSLEKLTPGRGGDSPRGARPDLGGKSEFSKWAGMKE